ncbi:hypothetical protein V1520DRAFT_370238 [Lipomyces starkeyi]|uniref:Uncharacterized protein n=1 Tax=Lipomyces starkeyi NRRL Y-11557 TaxID=675824 RepID=A0A1E3QCE4_LIPST|nr:hypothetical protein LIPSTDRAFT_205360 [Lipomyces starkeyi NRRL Y-11557]
MHRLQAVLSLLVSGVAQSGPACPTTCTTTTTVLSPTSTGQLTLSTPVSTTQFDETFLCAITPTVSGFPATSDVCVDVAEVTFFLGGLFVGQTPVCTSESVSIDTITSTNTVTVSGVTTPFGQLLTGSVGPDGTATPTETSLCFTAASPTCPSGFTPIAGAGASFTTSYVDVMATAVDVFVVQKSPSSSCCPTNLGVVPVGNFNEVSETILCATPLASGFPTCPQITLGDAIFTLSATFIADQLICTSTYITHSVFTSTSTENGTPGTSTYSSSITTATATDGISASVSPSFCVAASPTPIGACRVGFTSSTVTGIGSFTNAELNITATGTLTTAVRGTCTVSPTAYSLSSQPPSPSFLFYLLIVIIAVVAAILLFLLLCCCCIL